MWPVAILALPAAGDPNTVTVSFTPTLADGAANTRSRRCMGPATPRKPCSATRRWLSLWELAYSAGNDALTTSVELASMVPNDAGDLHGAQWL